MDKIIYIVTDYKNNFGSKFTASPYRSGFDKDLLKKLFEEEGYHIDFLAPSVLSNSDLRAFNNKIVLYTSQEDDELFYKSFLEDLIYSMELSGAIVIPSFALFHAHENKVFFEMIRKSSGIPPLNNFLTYWFGTYDEFKFACDKLSFPIVIKTYFGSMSRGVFLANNKSEAQKLVKKITRTNNLYLKIWDTIRFYKHKGYVRESWNRKKFILQEYIPGLTNDYKVLIYGSKYYVLERENKKGDFRASGQGNLSFIKELPAGLLDFSEKCFVVFASPQASFDIGFNGKDFFLFEAQFVYFGTYTIEYSEFYFKKENNNWVRIDEKSILEKEYAKSIVEFIEK